MQFLISLGKTLYVLILLYLLTSLNLGVRQFRGVPDRRWLVQGGVTQERLLLQLLNLLRRPGSELRGCGHRSALDEGMVQRLSCVSGCIRGGCGGGSRMTSRLALGLANLSCWIDELQCGIVWGRSGSNPLLAGDPALPLSAGLGWRESQIPQARPSFRSCWSLLMLELMTL